MIVDALKQHNEKENASFHMPGHKGGRGFVGTPLESHLFAYDTTELCDTDALIAPKGVILDAEQRAAALYGAAHSFYLVGGATCGILAMMYAAFAPGDQVLLDRNCHQSVIHGAIFAGIKSVYVTPEVSSIDGIPGTVSPETIAAALEQYPHCKGLVLTSPNYYGASAKLSKLAEMLHKAGKILLVDEAHGAHFPFSSAFPQSAMAQGADMSVVSLHKSMPAPNQTALLHINGRFDVEEIRQRVRMFQTSSPSYLFMAAMEQALEYGANEGEERTKEILKWLLPLNCPSLDDPFKLLPDFSHKGLKGEEVDKIFREKFGIYAEMTTANGLLLMVSWCNGREDIIKLQKALDYCNSLPDQDVYITTFKSKEIKLAEATFSPAQLRQKKQKKVALEASEGYVCAVSVAAFPPCIPILLPGEIITTEHIETLLAFNKQGAIITGLQEGKVTVCEMNG